MAVVLALISFERTYYNDISKRMDAYHLLVLYIIELPHILTLSGQLLISTERHSAE